MERFDRSPGRIRTEGDAGAAGHTVCFAGVSEKAWRSGFDSHEGSPRLASDRTELGLPGTRYGRRHPQCAVLRCESRFPSCVAHVSAAFRPVRRTLGHGRLLWRDGGVLGCRSVARGSHRHRSPHVLESFSFENTGPPPESRRGPHPTRGLTLHTKLSLIAALAVFPLTSQTAIILEGAVKDPQGLLIAAAMVDVYGPARRTIRTSDTGQYRLERLPPGRYRITAVAEGFALRETERVLQAASSADFELDVTPTATVIETASKTREDALRVPFLVTSVSRPELRDTATASFDEALRTVAGLQHATQGNFFTRVTTRGLRDTADVLTLVDGVALRQLNGSADLAMIPVTALQGVEFVKGSASSMYGRSAIGGAMQFYTVPAAGSDITGDLAFTRASFGTNEG
ncbi:MAG: hypothetical protein FJW30_09710, partial [Acidobacteria bacterium]|nr:hypothetical protein [Acidobacteriota bacterium]